MEKRDKLMTRQLKRYEERKAVKKLAKIEKKIYDGVNKLYWLKVVEKETKKIGDTTRDVEERNDETITNAALHIEEQKWFIAKYSDNHHNKELAGKPFRDYDFHKFLEKKGYIRELNNNDNKSEWFFDITYEQFKSELEEFVGDKPKIALILRNGQEYLVNKTIEGWDDGYDLTNVYGSVRIGKNIFTLSASNKKGYVPIYIGKNLTSQSSVVDDNNEFGVVPIMDTFSIHGILESDDNFDDKVQKIIDRIESITPDKKVHFIVDEVDDMSHTKKSRKVLVKIIGYFRDESEYNVKVTCMSGTRAFRGLKLLNDLRKSEELINELSITYNEMQILQPDTTVKRNFVGITVYSSDSVELSNINESIKSSIGRKDLSKLISKLVGDNDYNLKDTTDCPHWFIKFCHGTKTNAKQLVSLLNRTYSIVDGKSVYYHNINGDFTSNREAQDYCKKVIKNHPNRIVVFITQGMATTSFSVKTIGNTAIFTDNELTPNDIQSGHRGATWKLGKEWCNIVLITTNDSNEMKFDDIFEEEKIGLDRKEKVIVSKEILQTNSITYVLQDGYVCDGVNPISVTIDDIENVIAKQEKDQLKRSSIAVSLIDEDFDYDLLKRMLSGKSLNTSIKSNTKKGKTIYPFGKNTINRNKKTIGVSKKTMDSLLKKLSQVLIDIVSVSKMMNIPIDEFSNWELVNMYEDVFTSLYHTNPVLRDKLDNIYNVCEDEKELVSRINSLTL